LPCNLLSLRLDRRLLVRCYRLVILVLVVAGPVLRLLLSMLAEGVFMGGSLFEIFHLVAVLVWPVAVVLGGLLLLRRVAMLLRAHRSNVR